MAERTSPVRTLLMTADAVGGVWTYSLELARALVPRGVAVALATMGPRPSASQRAEAASVPGLTLYESDFLLEWMADPWGDVACAGEWLLDLEARLAPDVVHLNGYCHGALPWHRRPLVVGHSCVLSWWRAVHGGTAPATWKRYRAEVTRGLRAAGRVAAPTRAMLSSLEEDYGPFRARGRAVGNARDRDRFRPAAKEPFILAAGRLWDPAKNLATLDEAAARVPWPVLVAGDLSHPAGEARPPRHARALGPLAAGDLAALMGRAGVYALPARYEPFGLSALEAALSGCALVLGDIPSLREVWGDAAEWVAPGDAEGLANTLRRLCADGDLRDRRAAAAGERAAGYRPERMADEYLALYRELGSDACA